MNKFLMITGIIALLLTVIYLSGPTPQEITASPEINYSDMLLSQVEQEVFMDTLGKNVRPGNEAEIVWYNNHMEKTPYSLVYLHGFSASKAEGEPVHRQLAKRFGCNLYLPRLYKHGIIEEEPMRDLTADSLIESAKKAIEVGAQIGENVIVIGTSTGGTLGLYLAASNQEITGLLLYSPNIRVFHPLAAILNDPWGLQLARLINQSEYHQWSLDSVRENFWTNKYRYEALVELEQMVESTMTEDVFNRIEQPVFLGYYYKNEDEQDRTVSVSAMFEMFDQLGTPENKKVKMSFPNAGHHVIASQYTSNDYQGVYQASENFMRDILSISKKKEQFSTN